MTINCFTISAGRQLSRCEYNWAIDSIRKQSERIWIDITDPEDQELEEKLDETGVRGLIRRFCLESRDHPGFYPMHPLALMVLPVQMEVQDTNTMEYLALLFSPGFLISVRNSKMARFQKTISIEDSADVLPDDSIAGIISSLLMGLSLDCLRKAARLSDIISALEEKMNRTPDAVQIEEISDKRSELLTLEAIVQGQLPIIEAVIISRRASIISETTQEYLVWAAANLKSADRKLDWLEHRIEVMRSLIDMHAQDRTNRRLGRLTVLSAIFMPITFLVSIWGMNFKYMPLLTLQNGLFIAMMIIFGIAGAMYLYFKRKGWFD